jgi:simple sugar transport system ATP-binding protein
MGAAAGAPQALAPKIREVAQRYGLVLEPQRLVHSLSIGERQRVEIVRCLMQDIRLLILDEPTSVLTPQEADELFVTLRRLASEGCSILFISHKLAEVRALCHSATVLRGGRVAGHCRPAECSDQQLAQLMVGDAAQWLADYPKASGGAPFLKVSGLSWANPDPFGCSLHDIDLQVRSGEVVDIAGVAGNGQDELLALLSGEQRLPRQDASRIAFAGQAVADLPPDARRRLGFCPGRTPRACGGAGVEPGRQRPAHGLPTGPGEPRADPACQGRGAGRDHHPALRGQGRGCPGCGP